MRKRIRLLMGMLLLPAMLTGCIVVPWDDGYGGRHHRGGHGGGYDGRR